MFVYKQYIEGLDLSLKREFYERLSSVQSIHVLSVGPHLEKANFEHFLKLKPLRSVVINSEKIPIEFLSSLCEQLKHLASFMFCSTTSSFRINVHAIIGQLDDFEYPPEATLETVDPREFRDRYSLSYSILGQVIDIAHISCKDAKELAGGMYKMKEDDRLKVYKNCFFE